jgi:hypothetical protein
MKANPITNIRFRGRIGRRSIAFVHSKGVGSNSTMFISNFTAWRRHQKKGDLEATMPETISHEQLHITLKNTAGVTASRRLDFICGLANYQKEGLTGLPDLSMLEARIEELKKK